MQYMHERNRKYGVLTTFEETEQERLIRDVFCMIYSGHEIEGIVYGIEARFKARAYHLAPTEVDIVWPSALNTLPGTRARTPGFLIQFIAVFTPHSF